ncbi:prepilin-type N-terminal cleavage/methylation domain-containing protein [Aliiglaciecola sp. CAU 1673]|uniref:type IV pilus modification PilV family protein n=1 Tax=Aliiglaciecola sp. CAU 1673 TaxID=3032595 RepID=UPI0023DB8AD0|nr:prepilin-type N-terminal cleavage/methylation domain-containing protein [Aliiglaciecola sp. CAU 1673]MDF2179132.1 prepilin-type N-terminal cleavage/methylation domain-containing protein [Aliiglaciecola sp. CAU 1673]
MAVRSSIGNLSAFTLVELVAGLALFAIVMTIILSTLLPQASRSVNPIIQVRTVELAQSLLDEMAGKAFDEQSDRGGGRYRCDEDADGSGVLEADEICTVKANLGCDAGETSRDQFDDVDDYRCLDGLNAVQALDTTERPMSAEDKAFYQGFVLGISVDYEGAGAAPTDRSAYKRVRLTVSPPGGQTMVFGSIKGNY